MLSQQAKEQFQTNPAQFIKKIARLFKFRAVAAYETAFIPELKS